jgi:hypothetical protein
VEKKDINSWVWWHKPVIPAIQEVQAGGLSFEANHVKISKTLSQKQPGGACL